MNRSLAGTRDNAPARLRSLSNEQKAIADYARYYGLSDSELSRLRDALRVEYTAEWFSADRPRQSDFPIPPETARLLAEFGRRPYTEQSPREKRSTRRRTRKLTQGGFDAPALVARPGQQPFPAGHEWLARRFIERIETATGRRVGFYRPRGGGQPTGPALRLLQAAMKRALFASGGPGRERLARVIRKYYRERALLERAAPIVERFLRQVLTSHGR